MSNPLVIIVAHGSRSKRWVAAVKDWFEAFSEKLDEMDARLSFLEIAQPLFSDVLREEKGRDLHILPFFLSRSGHAGDDIPSIAQDVIGEGGYRILRPEGWESLLGRNAERRLRSYGATPGLPVIVSGYGASSHDEVWLELVEAIRLHAGPFSESPWLWAPSGHFLDDSEKPLRGCLTWLHRGGYQQVAILPLYLSISSYQEQLIPDVVDEFSEMQIYFKGDAILPDPQIADWAAKFVRTQINHSTKTTKDRY